MTFIRYMGFIGLMSLLGPLARADISAEIAEASAPLSEGVPEVAVVRLQALLDKNLSDAEMARGGRKNCRSSGGCKGIRKIPSSCWQTLEYRELHGQSSGALKPSRA